MSDWEDAPAKSTSGNGWEDAPAKPKGLRRELARQSGLTARYGIEGLADFAGIATNPMAATINAATGANMPRLRDATSSVLDRMGLPKPEGATQRVIGDMSRAMVGMGGFSQAAQRTAPMVSGASKSLMETLARNQGAQQLSAAGAGFGGGVARESDAGPGGQLAAALAGSVATPAGMAGVKWAGGHLADAGAAVGASFGNQRAINRLAGDAAKRVAGGSREQIIDDIANMSDDGYSPTVAEAIVQGQIGKAGQHGGATVKLQKDLTGAKGIEDVLTGTARTQKVAIANSVKELNAKMTPIREQILADVNKNGGVDPSKITDKIDEMLAAPKISLP